MNIKKLPELLSPAGSLGSVKAAVSAGANAIYIGRPTLSARSAAGGFSNQELCEIIDYCHLRGVKVYITVNIVYTDSEFDELFRHMAAMYEAGADAFIMQDIGAAMTAKQMFPNIELHASTQMTAQNLNDVLFLQNIGFSRVILSREVSLEEIQYIVSRANVGIEIFVHGALCVSYSGQCLMSGHIGKRSGNRGRCAQPCRQKYNLIRKNEISENVNTEFSYLLSLKDLMSLPFLNELAEVGVAALKIEGRSKTPEYVAQATRAYREGLDSLIRAGVTDRPTLHHATIRNLHQTFNRGGFTDGYFSNHSGTHMMSVDSPKSLGAHLGRVVAYNRSNKTCKVLLEHSLVPGDGIFVFTKTEPHPGTNISKQAGAGEIAIIPIEGNINIGDTVYKSYDKKLMDELRRIYEGDTRKIDVNASVQAVIGQPLTLIAQYNIIEVTKTGNIVAVAENKPVSAERIIEQLSKTGGTPFSFNFSENNNVAENIFIGVSQLNELRREVVAELEQQIISSFKRTPSGRTIGRPQLPNGTFCSATPHLTILVRNPAQFNAALASNVVDRIYFEPCNEFLQNINLYVEKCNESSIELFAALPCIGDSAEHLERLENSGIDGYLCRNYGGLFELAQTKKLIALDFNFNIINSAAFSHFKANSVCLSYENTLENIRHITATGEGTAEIMIHGKIPVMTTRQCPVGLYDAGKCGKMFCKLRNSTIQYELADKTGAKFPIVTNCHLCIAQILSDRPLFMLGKMNEVRHCGAGLFRIMLHNETPDDVLNLCLAYKGALTGETNDGAEGMVALSVGKEFTYGYFFNGFA